ncbi:hypothetical protein GOP47_0025237 [Adiantum capillus-veneris]|uniref:Myb/SANT-like DNA-binding domain-containing protein n=1 Tax=Adiantum capillus-veneris TaxID=13818 RepID=A0A9D4Z512_ADICA|nr:hypothetical protein GOP47_0025237 [Adiantum capillus-veneris]
MEDAAKIDLEQNCSSLALGLGSKPAETIVPIAGNSNTLKQPDSHSLHNSLMRVVEVHTGEPESIKMLPETDKKQVMPLAISLSTGVQEPNVAMGLKGTAASRSVSAEGAMSGKMLPHSLTSTLEGGCAESASLNVAASMDALPLKGSSRLEDTRAMQPVASAGAHRGELPSSASMVSDGSHVLQLASSAPVVPHTKSETENGLFSSDGGVALKREKVKKRPRQLLQDARTRDLNKSGEKQPVIRWKDVWVAQLIHIRGRMHSTFTSPQRQRVDLWQIVKHEMTNSCHGFDKDSEACRKKWIRVYKEYKDDRYLSNDEKTQKCRFYDLVDFYMGDRVNSLRNIPIHPEFLPMCPDAMHAAKDLMVPPPLPSNDVDVKAIDGGAMVPQASSDTPLIKQVSVSISKKPPLAKKPRVIEKPLSLEKPQPPPVLEAPVVEATSKKPYIKSSVQTMLSELVNIGKEMLQTTREFEKEKLAVLHSIKDTLGKIAKKI